MVHVDDVDPMGAPWKAFARYQGAGGAAELVFVVQVDKWDDEDESEKGCAHFHFHVNIDRAEDAKATDGIDELPVDELKERLEPFMGCAFHAYIDAQYEVELDDIPPHGMIQTLMGVSTDSDGSEMELTGAKFAISSDIYSELTWTVDEVTGLVSGKISGELGAALDGNFLRQVFDAMESGVRRFVLETPDGGKTHGADVQGKSSDKKAAEG